MKTFVPNPHLEMLMQREQLMEDIDSIVESISSVMTDDYDIDWNTIEVSHEELTRMLCDAVCKNFPAQWQSTLQPYKFALQLFLLLLFSTTLILPMHSTTLDLFCNDDNNRDDDQFNIDAAFDAALEESAARLEVTVDYYIEEFLLWIIWYSVAFDACQDVGSPVS